MALSEGILFRILTTMASSTPFRLISFREKGDTTGPLDTTTRGLIDYDTTKQKIIKPP